jgi:hypothetical protein
VRGPREGRRGFELTCRVVRSGLGLAGEREPVRVAGIPTAGEQGFAVSWPTIPGVYVGAKVADAGHELRSRWAERVLLCPVPVGGGEASHPLDRRTGVSEHGPMAYDLHIERRSAKTEDSEPILIEEWLAAIEATQGVRVFTGAKHTVANPNTGDVISSRARPGDAEVRCGAEWKQVFSWFEGSAKFRARGVALGDPSDPIWAAAAALANRVGAVICGDEGECYDPNTGEEIG